MAHPFELTKEIEIAATPEQVWEAVATGPGIDGWFLGTGNEVEPRLGGRVRVSFGEASGESTVTAWEPPRRYAHRGEAGPDGTFHAMEYTIESRAGGITLVRLVHSGFLADDWEAEYDALNEGDFMYLHQMAQYVIHFLGRRASILVAMRPDVDRDTGLATLRRELGVSAGVSEGDRVRLAPEGVPPVEGVVDFLSPSFVGVRGPDALYRFMLGSGVAYLGHHVFRDVDVTAETAAWQAWVDSTFA
jgi:uncharacterized protein YndB with AHSA1/START domain